MKGMMTNSECNVQICLPNLAVIVSRGSVSKVRQGSKTVRSGQLCSAKNILSVFFFKSKHRILLSRTELSCKKNA